MNDSDMHSDDELLHYGVKGMRWGVRKRVDLVRAQNAEIKTARARQALRKDKVRTAKTDAARDKALRDLRESPDYAVAKRKTTGQKIAFTIAGAVGTMTLASLGLTALSPVSTKSSVYLNPTPEEMSRILGG